MKNDKIKTMTKQSPYKVQKGGKAYLKLIDLEEMEIPTSQTPLFLDFSSSFFFHLFSWILLCKNVDIYSI